jgi:3-oxoacyl-[acyl-carrier protein] reductase
MTDPELAGRVAVITGASRGIGAATARRLAAAGAEVILVARSTERIVALADDIAASGGRASALPCDVADRTALSRLVERLGQLERLDILVNNAAVLPKARRLERGSWADWDAVMGLNLAGPWFLCCRAKELMRLSGVIVNVASTAAFYPSIGLGIYNISKAAVLMLTRAAALEWAAHGIRVVGVAPGLTDTEMAVPLTAYFEAHDLPPNPMKRLGTPDEVAELIAYVVSDRAAFVTGSTFTLDGGELVATAAG